MKTLKELQEANLPVCTPADLGPAWGEADAEYLRCFVVGACPRCGSIRSGWHPITNGAILCSGCRWPGQRYHPAKEKNAPRRDERLFFHPSILEEPSDASEEESC